MTGRYDIIPNLVEALLPLTNFKENSGMIILPDIITGLITE